MVLSKSIISFFYCVTDEAGGTKGRSADSAFGEGVGTERSIFALQMGHLSLILFEKKNETNLPSKTNVKIFLYSYV
jgi:hypothetical protein